MDEIDRDIHMRIAEWQAYGQSQLVQESLRASDQTFSEMAHVQAYIDHRLEREQQILGCLRDGLESIPDMVAKVYAAVPKHLHPAAGRSMLAHLVQFVAEGRVLADGPPTIAARYKLP